MTDQQITPSKIEISTTVKDDRISKLTKFFTALSAVLLAVAVVVTLFIITPKVIDASNSQACRSRANAAQSEAFNARDGMLVAVLVDLGESDEEGYLAKIGELDKLQQKADEANEIYKKAVQNC